jgi:hypothetical protein
VRSKQVVLDSSIAVMVLLSPENTDMEFWLLRPHMDARTSREDFDARRLRSVGVIGLQGVTPACAFKEPLDAQIVNGIAGAFLEYIRVLIGQCFVNEHHTGDAVGWLDRLYLLPDSRAN